VNSEATLLGLMLKDESVFYLAGMKAEHFSDPRCKKVFVAMEKALSAHGYLARDTVQESLDDPKLYNQVKAEADNEIFPDRWEFHRHRVLQAWKQEQVLLLFSEVRDAFNASMADPDQEIEMLIESLYHLKNGYSSDSSVDYRKALAEALEELSVRYNLQGQIPGISSGIRAIDAVTGGFLARRLYYVAARPSQGKSALLGQIADHMARDGRPVGFMSLESGRTELVTRNLSRRYGVRQSNITSGMITPSQFVDLNAEVENVSKHGLWIDDTPNAEIGHIRRQAQVWRLKNKIEALFVDYVQLIRVKTAGDKRESVEEASRALKDMSRQLGIPVIAAAQLRRDVDGRDPHLGDFQHSSALEQDADVAMLLHWKADYGDIIPVDCYVAKNRDGQKSIVPLSFVGSLVKFTEREAGYDN